MHEKTKKIIILIVILVLMIIFSRRIIKNSSDPEIPNSSDIKMFCANHPGPSFCQGGLEALISNGTDQNGCTIWACKDGSETSDFLEKNSLKPGDYKMKIINGNVERYYLLHIPQSYSNKPTRLILAFHGGMGTAEIQRDYYGWVEKSDKEGFVVAFPNGASRFDSGKLATWNAGKCCGYATESNSDDVGFVKAIINDIKLKTNINKIFATGMSNGGMLSHRLACEMSDVFTAIAAVSGTNNYDNCNPKNPISVLHIHGLLDDHVLYNGGCGPKCIIKSETDFTSVPETISAWVNRNNCTGNPKRVLENQNGYCDLYSQCKNNVQVELCVAEDGGHSWPGATSSPSSNVLEKSTPSQAFSATDLIWNFFKSN